MADARAGGVGGGAIMYAGGFGRAVGSLKVGTTPNEKGSFGTSGGDIGGAWRGIWDGCALPMEGKGMDVKYGGG